MKVKPFFASCLFSFFLCLAFTSCDYNLQQFLYRDNSVEDRLTGLSASTLSGSSLPSPLNNTYKVAIITDVHFGAGERGTLDADFIAWASAHNMAFCICLGDVAEHGAEAEYKQYASFVTDVKAVLTTHKVYSTVGNHDLYSDGWKWWKKYVNTDFNLDTSFYTFTAGGFSWYFIDSASGTLGVSQFKALTARMEEDSNPKIVLSHFPLYADGAYNASYPTLQNSMETSRLIDLFARNNVKFFASGHSHHWAQKSFGSFYEVNFTGFNAKKSWGYIEVDATSGQVIAYDKDGKRLL